MTVVCHWQENIPPYSIYTNKGRLSLFGTCSNFYQVHALAKRTLPLVHRGACHVLSPPVLLKLIHCDMDMSVPRPWDNLLACPPWSQYILRVLQRPTNVNHPELEWCQLGRAG